MDEARAVIERLRRIEALERRDDVPAQTMLGELRALVAEAEQWARRERDPEAVSAVDRCRAALETVSPNHDFTVSLLG